MRWTSYLLLGLLGAIWGASFLLIKIGVAEISPFTFATLRIALGALTLGVVLLMRRKPIPHIPHWGRHLSLIAITGVALPFAAIAWGTQYIASSLSAILNATMPLFTFLLVVLSGHEQMRLRNLGGVLMGFGGILILTLPQLLSGPLKADALGQLAVILGALSYAIAIVYVKQHLASYSPLTLSFGQLGLATLFLTPLAISEKPTFGSVTYQAVAALLILGIVGTALAYLIYYRLIALEGATFTSLVTYITPLFGIFWGRLILNEHLRWNAVAALGLILMGLLLVREPQAKPSPKSESTSKTVAPS